MLHSLCVSALIQAEYVLLVLFILSSVSLPKCIHVQSRRATTSETITERGEPKRIFFWQIDNFCCENKEGGAHFSIQKAPHRLKPTGDNGTCSCSARRGVNMRLGSRVFRTGASDVSRRVGGCRRPTWKSDGAAQARGDAAADGSGGGGGGGGARAACATTTS